jgi:hypothetical protein
MDEITKIAVACASEDTVLVGGMAVSMLAQHYNQAHDEPIYTRDVDFYGDRLAMEKAAQNMPWNTREYLASMNDATPNTGKLAVDISADTEPVEVDFLYRLDGLSSDDIEQKAIVIKIGKKTFRILHPLLVMENKVNNLAIYPSKRTPEGIQQAKVAIKIVKSYLASIEDEREQLNALERIGRYAKREASCFAHKAFSIDVLESIPDRPLSKTFRIVRLPQIQQHLAERRVAFEKAWKQIAKRQDPKRKRFRL